MSKMLYVDVETTGIDPLYCGIIQLAFIVEIDGVVKEQHHFKVRPFETDRINAGALKTVGVTIDEIMTYEDPNKVYWKFRKVLEKYVDVYDKDKSKKFFPVGYNVQFDLDFLKSFFLKNDDKFIGSYFNWKKLDVLQLLYWFHYKGVTNFDSYKLETVCSGFNIPLVAHDALSDITATRELFKMLEKRVLLIGVDLEDVKDVGVA